jgi:hypothetical protein
MENNIHSIPIIFAFINQTIIPKVISYIIKHIIHILDQSNIDSQLSHHRDSFVLVRQVLESHIH